MRLVVAFSLDRVFWPRPCTVRPVVHAYYVSCRRTLIRYCVYQICSAPTLSTLSLPSARDRPGAIPTKPALPPTIRATAKAGLEHRLLNRSHYKCIARNPVSRPITSTVVLKKTPIVSSGSITVVASALKPSLRILPSQRATSRLRTGPFPPK